MWKEFKAFISRGNVIDMAVGIIIGGAFTAIVTSLVNDILMPLIGVVIGGVDFTSLAVTVGDSSVTYGNFLQAILNFLLIALALFFLIKGINALHRKPKETPAPTTKECPYCLSVINIKATRCPHCTSEQPQVETKIKA